MNIDAWKIREVVYLFIIALLTIFFGIKYFCEKEEQDPFIEAMRNVNAFNWGGFFPPDLVPHPHLPQPAPPPPRGPDGTPHPSEIV